MGITRVNQLVQDFLDQGIAKSTKAVYQSGWQQYPQFCSKHHRPSLPLHESTLSQFAVVMAQTVSRGTIRVYLSALRFFQIRAGLSDRLSPPDIYVERNPSSHPRSSTEAPSPNNTEYPEGNPQSVVHSSHSVQPCYVMGSLLHWIFLVFCVGGVHTPSSRNI